MGKLHLLVLHFPIALIVAAGLAGAIYLLTRREAFKSAGVYCMVIGALGAVASAVTGDMLGDMDEMAATIKLNADLFEIHEALGIATAVVASLAGVAGVLWQLPKIGPKPIIGRLLPYAYGVLVLAAVVLVSLAGHWGGMLAFGKDYMH